jgi:hypothetical protein
MGGILSAENMIVSMWILYVLENILERVSITAELSRVLLYSSALLKKPWLLSSRRSAHIPFDCKCFFSIVYLLLPELYRTPMRKLAKNVIGKVSW